MLSVAEEEQLAADLEILFTRYVQLLPDGSFTLNEANLREDGEGEQIAELYLLVDGLIGIGISLGWAAWSCKGKL